LYERFFIELIELLSVGIGPGTRGMVRKLNFDPDKSFTFVRLVTLSIGKMCSSLLDESFICSSLLQKDRILVKLLSEKTELVFPEEFQKKLDEFPALKTAFDALTP